MHILVADDDLPSVKLPSFLLEEAGYRVMKAYDGPSILQSVEQHAPDLVLLDVHLPDASGLDVLRRLSRARSKPKVILLTAGMDEAQLLAAAELEPEGMVLKTSDPGLLLECMDTVVAGKSWVDPEIAEHTRRAEAKAASAPPLTRRERELIELVRQGLRNRDIAAELGVTEGTVKVYLHAIFDKFHVENRTELALRAAELIRG